MTRETRGTARRAFLTGAAAALPLATAATLGSRPAAAQDSFAWRFQTLWAAGSINMTIFQDFCTRVGAMSGGRLTIEPLASGTVVGPMEMYDAVADGILDGQNGGGGYVAQKDIAFVMLGDLAGAYETPDQMQSWYEYGGGKELARELYAAHGTHHAGLVWHGMESIPSRVPIRTIEEFKGVKMRSPTGAVSKILEILGAAPVTMPGGEVYTSMERGVIDATDWGTLSMNVDLGFEKIAPYALYPGFHSLPATDIVVNMERWNELPDDLKEIVTVATRDFGRDMHQRLGLKDQEIAATAKDRGLELIDWSEADRRKFREIAAGVWQELAKDSPMAQQVVDSQTAFLKQIGLL